MLPAFLLPALAVCDPKLPAEPLGQSEVLAPSALSTPSRAHLQPSDPGMPWQRERLALVCFLEGNF